MGTDSLIGGGLETTIETTTTTMLDCPGTTLIKTATVLVVDDEGPILELARRMLKAQGYKVLSACDGRQALELADRHGEPIDLLFTDVVMPRMGGDELAMELGRRRPGMRVLYMSGYIEPGVLGPGVPLLPKPFSSAILTQAIEDILKS